MNKGFTLIELLIVIAIIGILASTVVIQLGGATDSAQDAKNKLQVSQVRPFGEFQKVANLSAGYSNFCNDSEVAKVLKKISNNATFLDNGSVAGSFSTMYTSTNANNGTTGCAAWRDGWAILFKLTAYEGTNPDNGYYCADTEGLYVAHRPSGQNGTPLTFSSAANVNFSPCKRVFNNTSNNNWIITPE